MRFTSLNLYNFRNISSAEMNSDAEDIVLTGINGQGKTNVLEAVYTLCYGNSFRTPNLRECIKIGSDGFRIEASFSDDECGKQKVKVVFKDNKRHIFIDDKEIKDRKELIYTFPCIVFCHQDIDFIKGEPEMRRRFFDQMMSLYSPLYFDNLRNYRRVLLQRNAAIKTGNYSLASLYNERLSYFGLEIMRERTSTVYEFNRIFPELFRIISETDHKLRIDYQPSWKNSGSEDEIISYLDGTSERDMSLQTTSSGIHRDKFVIMSDDGPFSLIGSTGQLRLCSLIMRISEARYFTQMTGRKPILLIDDVLLELDPEKRGRFISLLDDYSQAFFTFLPFENYFERKEDAIYYKVEKGEFLIENRSQESI